MDGKVLEQPIKEYIVNNLVKQLINDFPILKEWENKILILPEGFNKNRATSEQLKQADNALFVIRTNTWTDIPEQERKIKKANDKSYAKNDSANRDIVIYELIHDKYTGKLLYQKNGYPLYRRVPLMNIECKLAHFSNVNEIYKSINYKISHHIPLTNKEANIYIVKEFLDWCKTQPDIMKEYPAFMEPDYQKDLVLSFFTTLTQSDNAYAILAYKDRSMGKESICSTWGYISKDKAKNKNIICPEINVENLKRFIKDRKLDTMPKAASDIINKLLLLPEINKKCRDYFKYGSDQKYRSLNIVAKEDIKTFTKKVNDNIVEENNDLLKDIFTKINKYTNKSMLKIVTNYLNWTKTRTQHLQQNSFHNKQQKFEDVFAKQLKYKADVNDILNSIDNFNKDR